MDVLKYFLISHPHNLILDIDREWKVIRITLKDNEDQTQYRRSISIDQLRMSEIDLIAETISIMKDVMKEVKEGMKDGNISR